MPNQPIDLWHKLSPAQARVFRSPARFRVLVAGRRFGKTQLALIELLASTLQSPGRIAWYLAPSCRQAKRIAWERLKSLVATMSPRICETELTICLPNGSAISLRGADNYDSLRGNALDFVVLDEFAGMKPEVWTEVLRPALADRLGRALFIGTPQGHNHLYDTFERASKNPQPQPPAHSRSSATEPQAQARGGFPPDPTNPQSRDNFRPSPSWAAFQYTTLDGGFVTEDELRSAASELDERLYRQEFEASFESTALGLAYHAFNRDIHVRPCSYNHGGRLIWSLDFNVNPMSSVIAQRNGDTVEVLDELIIQNANTWMACQQFWQRAQSYRHHYGALAIDIYGDASGHQRRTSAAETDWTLIKQFFAQLRGQAVIHVKAATSNPAVRDRVNIVNARLLSAAGETRLHIDPRCKELIADFERVCWSVDSLGQPTSELDKSDRTRTHSSDALGYYLAQAFPMTTKIGPQPERLF